MTTEMLETVKLEDRQVPVLPLRDVVVYPHMVMPLFIGRDKSIEALDQAMLRDKQILLVAQKNAELDDPGFDDLFEVGTLSNIRQLLKLPDGTVKLLVEGGQRCKVLSYTLAGKHYVAEVEPLADVVSRGEQEMEALTRAAANAFDQYVKLDKRTSPEVLNALAGIDDPARLADTIATHLNAKIEEKQAVLALDDVAARLEKLISLMEGEADLLEMEKRIRGRVKDQMSKNQREYYLNEQMKAIQKELGDMEEVPNEFEELARKVEKAGMPKAARAKAEVELNKLRQMSPMSAEATVVRNYIDWMVNVPWKKRTRVSLDLKKAAELLEAEHYGLDKVKERILEYLAVQQRVKSMKGPILCLVGPPGVGKTSLGQSIARATNRKYVRMALGGVRDEAEIRGHRRTYIGALPGKILQNLAKVKTRNPMFMLDEIDKMAMDFRGDPASALLEVLDPAQNHTFNDHYLEVDFDLSEVMFIATANTLDIPPALLDRMEVIRLAGYTEDEKINIALRYLIPKQIKNNGLKDKEIQITESAVRDVIRFYTREAGVRSLEREIAKICRKVVKSLVLKPSTKKVLVTHRNLENFLGVQRYRYGRAEENDQVGQVTGLAWTEVGGELLTIEAAIMPGTGKQTYTGKLGEVMQESIRTAVTVARTRSEELGIAPTFYQKDDVHIHVPEGATPKDGPSAGIGMCTALVSALTKIPVRSDVAMTGEITLRGEVLPIGGLKEKLLAAHRGGIETVLIPKENEKDLAEIPKNVKQDLRIVPVRWIDEVLNIALQRKPEPLAAPLPVEAESASAHGGAITAH
ncbi:endopeptidase La [Methylococcus sp. EFPC2]|uniref:endopeptidase La n=1 Tax=Methylococcus sp. EFPC2 TaxID=2812648 RepID=UPI00196734E8|nr:endopeptidase La [Methylococcus sp. EFPC2]QSA99293.1 endopeptidase La [Methylococcus sp. EFPC2]